LTNESLFLFIFFSLSTVQGTTIQELGRSSVYFQAFIHQFLSAAAAAEDVETALP